MHWKTLVTNKPKDPNALVKLKIYNFFFRYNENDWPITNWSFMTVQKLNFFFPFVFCSIVQKRTIFHDIDTVPFRMPLFSSSIASGDKSVCVKWSFVWFENEICLNFTHIEKNTNFVILERIKLLVNEKLIKHNLVLDIWMIWQMVLT